MDQLYDKIPVHLLQMLKKSLEMQKEIISTFGTADAESKQRSQQSRDALLLHAAAVQAKLQKGEELPGLDCMESVDDRVSRHTVSPSVDALQLPTGEGASQPLGVTSRGHADPRKELFEYFLDQDYMDDADNYLEDWMAKRWGPLHSKPSSMTDAALSTSASSNASSPDDAAPKNHSAIKNHSVIKNNSVIKHDNSTGESNKSTPQVKLGSALKRLLEKVHTAKKIVDEAADAQARADAQAPVEAAKNTSAGKNNTNR